MLIARASASRISAFAAVCVVAPVGCSDAQGPSDATIVERRISPTLANARVTQWTSDHIVWLGPKAAESTRIMLLLPGSNGSPSNFLLIGRIAAQQGYRTIGLMYPDDRAVVAECSGDTDEGCMASMRSEIIEGIDRSTHVVVDHDNSIDGRLADLIACLARTYPSEKWETFLGGDGALKWDRIAVGGLSQGGGHAAYIAKLRAVPRVVMFGAPADGYNSQVAPWMQLGATPVERYYGFRHVRDPFLSIQPNWIALGMNAFGDAKDVQAGTTDFEGSHMLTTDLVPATGSYGSAHPSVFGDYYTPKRKDGSPVFDRAWRYLLGTAP